MKKGKIITLLSSALLFFGVKTYADYGTDLAKLNQNIGTLTKEFKLVAQGADFNANFKAKVNELNKRLVALNGRITSDQSLNDLIESDQKKLKIYQDLKARGENSMRINRMAIAVAYWAITDIIQKLAENSVNDEERQGKLVAFKSELEDLQVPIIADDISTNEETLKKLKKYLAPDQINPLAIPLWKYASEQTQKVEELLTGLRITKPDYAYFADPTLANQVYQWLSKSAYLGEVPKVKDESFWFEDDDHKFSSFNESTKKFQAQQKESLAQPITQPTEWEHERFFSTLLEHKFFKDIPPFGLVTCFGKSFIINDFMVAQYQEMKNAYSTITQEIDRENKQIKAMKDKDKSSKTKGDKLPEEIKLPSTFPDIEKFEEFIKLGTESSPQKFDYYLKDVNEFKDDLINTIERTKLGELGQVAIDRKITVLKTENNQDCKKRDDCLQEEEEEFKKIKAEFDELNRRSNDEINKQSEEIATDFAPFFAPKEVELEQKRIADLTQMQDTLTAQQDEVQGVIDQKKRENEAQKTKIAVGQGVERDLKQQISATSKELNRIKEIKKEIKQKGSQIEILKERMATASTTKGSLLKQLKKAETESANETLDHQIKQQRLEIEKLEAELANSTKLKQEIDRLKSDLLSTAGQSDSLDQKIKGLEQQVESLTSAHQQATKDLSSIKQDLEQAQQQIDRFGICNRFSGAPLERLFDDDNYSRMQNLNYDTIRCIVIGSLILGTDIYLDCHGVYVRDLGYFMDLVEQVISEIDFKDRNHLTVILIPGQGKHSTGDTDEKTNLKFNLSRLLEGARGKDITYRSSDTDKTVTNYGIVFVTFGPSYVQSRPNGFHIPTIEEFRQSLLALTSVK